MWTLKRCTYAPIYAYTRIYQYLCILVRNNHFFFGYISSQIAAALFFSKGIRTVKKNVYPISIGYFLCYSACMFVYLRPYVCTNARVYMFAVRKPRKGELITVGNFRKMYVYLYVTLYSCAEYMYI